VLMEHGERVGRKILISGGGRCNFTNVGTRAENFLSENPHFAKSALARFTPADFIAMVERTGIRYHEKTLGQLFCDGSSRQIVDLLQGECDAAGVETRCGVKVAAVRREGSDSEGFVLETDAGAVRCEAVVVATGGLSIPKMGATGFGYELARGFGHAVVEPRAALVPLVFGERDREAWCDLTGLSAEVVARVDGDTRKARKGMKQPAFREKLLVTHRGVSGPAVLQISSYWRPGGEVEFDLAPGLLRGVLPGRLAERWVAMRAGREDWTNVGIAAAERELHAWTVRPAGTEGFAKAEVTAGGVDTRELDARTMESRRVAGMYFIGEVVDVTGWLGGYNFQWAWASGVAAGSVA
jgi:predicted Rossmann fold flavoprotein